MGLRDYAGDRQFKPLGAWAYIGLTLLFAIPVIGWILLIVFTFSRGNYNRRSFARSVWLWMLLFIVVVVILAATGNTWRLERMADGLEYAVSGLTERKPTAVRTASPTRRPTMTPTQPPAVTEAPRTAQSETASPTAAPTATQKKATEAPTAKPTATPKKATEAPTAKPTATKTPKPTEKPASTGVTPSFKKAMDEYEKFFDEYVDFMEDYDAATASLTSLAKYAKLLRQYAETMEALDDIDEDTLSDADARYYTQVYMRITQKLMSVMD